MLIGLWKKRECDIETIDAAKARLHDHHRKARDQKQKLMRANIEASPIPEESLDDESDNKDGRVRFTNSTPQELKELKKPEKPTPDKRLALRKEQTVKVPNLLELKDPEEEKGKRPRRKITGKL